MEILKSIHLILKILSPYSRYNNEIGEKGCEYLKKLNCYKIISGNNELDQYILNKTKQIKEELLDNLNLIPDLWNIILKYTFVIVED